MKHVRKGAPPDSFLAWKAKANEDWSPTYDNLQNPEKMDLHKSLLAEQGEVCCYCGRRVGLLDSHIEHFRPQECRLDLELDYSNLYASCLREVAREQPLHCGHAKKSQFDEANYISPQEEDCEQRFIYAADGQQLSAKWDDLAANYMVDILNLNAFFLSARRAAALAGVFDNEFLLNATPDELRTIRDAYREVDDAGRLPDMGHVIARFAEQRLSDLP